MKTDGGPAAAAASGIAKQIKARMDFMEAPSLRKPVFSPHFHSALACLASFAFVCAAASAQTTAPSTVPGPVPVRVIEIDGPIVPSLVGKIRAALEPIDADRFPAGAIVLLDTPGGDGLAAMEIGRIVRAAKAHVLVRVRCASACVYILAGGVVRGVARDRAIAIHKPRLTTFVKGIGLVDVNAASNPRAAQALEAGDRRSREYFKEMGMPDSLYTAMMAAPSDQTRYLELAELPALGLAGVDPAYRVARAGAAAARYRISEDDFVRRTDEVAQKCLVDKLSGRDLVRCYSRVLQTGG